VRFAVAPFPPCAGAKKSAERKIYFFPTPAIKQSQFRRSLHQRMPQLVIR
jgi:hypothetical protein